MLSLDPVDQSPDYVSNTASARLLLDYAYRGAQLSKLWQSEDRVCLVRIVLQICVTKAMVHVLSVLDEKPREA